MRTKTKSFNFKLTATQYEYINETYIKYVRRTGNIISKAEFLRITLNAALKQPNEKE